MSNIKLMLNNIAPHLSKKKIFLLSILLLIVSLLDFIGLSLFIPIIDSLQGQGSGHFISRYFSEIFEFLGIPTSLKWFLIFLSILFIIKTTIAMLSRRMGIALSSGLQHILRMRLLNGYLTSTLHFINSHRQGTLLSVLNEHTIRAGGSLFLLIQIILLWLTAFFYGVFVFIISWELTFVSFLLGVLMFPIIKKIGQLAHKHADYYTRALEKAQHFALESLQAKKLINAMSWGNSRLNSFEPVSFYVRDSWQWTAFWSNSIGIIMQPIFVMILSLIIILAVKINFPFAVLGAFIFAFLRLLPTIQSALTLGTEFKASMPSVKRINEFIVKAEKAFEPDGHSSFEKLNKTIDIENVKFSYSDPSSVILDDINISIQRGSTVAIVGPSGSGKTTIADLILGLNEPLDGRIIIDGVDLKNINKQQYRSKIAYIPQEPILFHDTIKNNLIIGLNRNVKKKEIRSVCIQAGAWDFIKERSNGLETIIGDRGVQLSGGQRQRIALARALLRKPQLMILDEATSALDHNSERWIQKTLEGLRNEGTFTIFIIAHRLTTIQHADIIYEVDTGRAKPLGKWKEAKEYLKGKITELELA